jgi:ATP-dependent Lon protease
MAAAIVSVFSKVAVRADVAMTGEITLRGRVLPVGGIKEKVLAAYRAGIREIIMPEENEKDLEDIPEDVRGEVRFHLVKDMDMVLEIALVQDVEAGVTKASGKADSRLPSPPLAH